MTSPDRLMAAGMPAGQAVQLAGGTKTGIVGTAGTKATAVQLVAGNNMILTCASAGVAAFQLPTAEGSPPVIVENDGASPALVFAAGSVEKINALSTVSSFSVTNAKRAIFWPVRKSSTALGWTAILSA